MRSNNIAVHTSKKVQLQDGIQNEWDHLIDTTCVGAAIFLPRQKICGRRQRPREGEIKMSEDPQGLGMVHMLTPQQAARYLGIGKTKLYDEINKGRLKAKRSGSQTLLSRDELDRWASALPDHRPADTATSARMREVRRRHH